MDLFQMLDGDIKMAGVKAGDRKNQGKIKLSLVSPLAVEEIAKVLMFGCEKYGPYNWEKGLSYTETYESLQRHLNQWLLGEDIDNETGLPHLAHAGCNIMFLLHFMASNRVELDDRHTFNIK